MTTLTIVQIAVVGTCVAIMFRGTKESRAASRAWVSHPKLIRRVGLERPADTEAQFVAELEALGVDAELARRTRRAIQDLVALHYGFKDFPVRASDPLRALYLFSLELYVDYPDDPGLATIAAYLADASKRRMVSDSSERELRLAGLQTVADLARWVHALPPRDDGADGSEH